MSSYFELVTSEDATTDNDSQHLVWSGDGDTPTVRASTNPSLTTFGEMSDPAIDLVRLATAALIADRRTRRPSTWSREIRLRVHARDPSSWTDGVETVTALLQFLSGDVWEVELVADTGDPPAVEVELLGEQAYDTAALFSGGLDSFCGALISESGGGRQYYVSQRDNPTVAGSQNSSGAWLRDTVSEDFSPLAITLAQAQDVVEGTSRTRSLLFLALGVAAAEARGAPTLLVPENGFTSLNPPLRPDRSGPLSTRSTHPYAFALFNLLRDQVGIKIAVENPYAWLTKGELVALASQARKDVAAGFAKTLSCAKLDGRLYKGGNQNWNCGLCVACIIRRGAIAAAGVEDQTPYVATKVKKTEFAKLADRRRSDIEAVKWALAAGVDDDALIGAAELPVDYDIDRGLDLWERSLKEIALVDLP